MATHLARRGAVAAPTVRGRIAWPRLRLPVRWRAIAHSAELDRQLAAGADPAASELLSRRGAQLTSERSRKRLAKGLETLVATPRGPAGLSSTIRPRADLRRSRAVLEALQRRLLSDELLRPGGVAILKWLLIDAASPLYADPDPEAVSSLLRLAAANMTSGGDP